jgi:hypothetical protein
MGSSNRRGSNGIPDVQGMALDLGYNYEAIGI